MRKRCRAPAAVFLIAFLSLTAAGRDPAGDLAGRVSALLLRFPADSAAEREAAAAELIRIGPGAVADLCGRLAAPGTADDSLVRYALDALAVRAGRPGAEAERKAAADGILAALTIPRDQENAVFLISLLQKIGRLEIVKPLGRFLTRPDLAEPAVRALTATGLPEAAAALTGALAAARDETAVAIIRGLGDLRAREAGPALLRLAEGNDPDLRIAALDALADIGDPAAREALERVRVAAPRAERSAAASRLLRFGRRLAEEGRPDMAADIARPFLSSYASPGEEHLRAAALTLFADAAGESEVRDAVRTASRSPDAAYRRRALDIAAGPRIPWSAGEWIGLLERAEPDAAVDVIRLLARKNEASALPAIRDILRAGEGAVRREAALAAARLGGAAVWDEIVPLFLSGDPADAAAAKKAVLLFPSESLVPAVAGLIFSAPPAGRVALLEILADRSAVSTAGAVFCLSWNRDERVRTAALAALEQTVTAEDLPAVVALLLQASTPSETLLLQNAAVAAARRIPDPEARAGRILEWLGRIVGPRRIDLLRPLSRIGGAAALEAVREEIRKGDPQARAVAVFTLAAWPDESAVPDLFRLARSASDKKTRYLALQGLARLIPGSSSAPDARLAALSEALAAAVEADEKALILDAIAAARVPEGLGTILRFLDDPDLRSRAARAVFRLVMPAAGYGGLSGLAAAAALKRAVPYIDYEFDRVPAERRALELLVQEGFQPLFNGKDLTGWKGLAADPPAWTKMTLEEIARAQAEADASMRAHWRVVDGVLSFDGRGGNLCTARDYGDFEMFVDWRIGPGGDSGLYLRGSPQVQIWDPDQRPEGSGGLYNNRIHPRSPAVRADRPAGEWNTFFIRMTGERVTVDLNGVRVVDDVVMENYWERDKPIYPAGQIELQAHDTPLEFKNILLREIPAGRTGS